LNLYTTKKRDVKGRHGRLYPVIDSLLIVVCTLFHSRYELTE
jgi:hypothetical protein